MSTGDYDVTDSDQDVSGDIGVSSGREGHVGPGQPPAPTGTRDNSIVEVDPDADVPPEQSAGGEETNPEGLPPKAGYPSADPRSKDVDPEVPPGTDRRPDEPARTPGTRPSTL